MTRPLRSHARIDMAAPNRTDTPSTPKERSCRDLNAAEQLVLFMTRRWVGAVTAPEGSRERHDSLMAWSRAFCHAGGPAAARSWDCFLSLVAHNAPDGLTTGCRKCGRPSADERRLLAALAAYQYGDLHTGRALIRHWLQDAQARLAEHHLILFAGRLVDASFRLRPPADTRGVPDRTEDSYGQSLEGHVMPAHATLH